jgi:hypothetical protein
MQLPNSPGLIRAVEFLLADLDSISVAELARQAGMSERSLRLCLSVPTSTRNVSGPIPSFSPARWWVSGRDELLLIRFFGALLRMSGNSSLPFNCPVDAAWKIWEPRPTNLGDDDVDGVVPLCQSLHLFSHRTPNASLHPFSPRYPPSRWLPASSSPSAGRTTTSAPHRAATSHDPVSRAHLFPDHVVSRAQYFNRPI